MATIDSTPPPWAAYLWHNGSDLFLQLPQSGHITKLSLTEGGLSKALKLIRNPCKATPNSHTCSPSLLRKPRSFKKNAFSEKTLAAAAEIMRRGK